MQHRWVQSHEGGCVRRARLGRERVSRHVEEAEHLSDPLDVASRNADLHNQRNVAGVRSAAAPEQVPDEDGNYAITECRDCGDELSAARLKTGRTRCVPCVDAEERRNKSMWRR